MAAIDLSQQELLDIFEYRDGYLWRKPFYDGNGLLRKLRKVTNTANHQTGYCVVNANGKQMRYHRVVWILHFGSIPNGMQIDHINGNKVDNRIENLRLLTNRENNQNKKIHKNGKLVGCYYNKNERKWLAQAYFNQKAYRIGSYNTELEAHYAYLNFLNERGVAWLIASPR